MRIRPLAALSVAALSAVLLAGCANGAAPESSPSPAGTGSADLCAAVAPSGAASEAVTVEGEFGEKSEATFSSPLEVEELQSTVVTEGDGDAVAAGELVTYALSAFNAETGEELGSFGYGENPVLPQQISP
ncbi:MAG TPA: FKBP-type peptidyl-prolyl cis-trans isomerase, partial [Agromyces sp.]